MGVTLAQRGGAGRKQGIPPMTPIIAQRVPILQIHEPQARCAFDGAWVEQDCRDAGFAMHLVEELRHMIDPGCHRRHAGQEYDVPRRVQVGRSASSPASGRQSPSER